MAAEEGADWLGRLYEEQGATLHRLVVLLGAESQSGRIVRNALLALHRRGHRIFDPAERIEFLQENVVHAARATRQQSQPLELPAVEDPRQEQLLRALAGLPSRLAEIIIVSHYLSVFGPELAGIMRMSLRATNQRMDIARRTLRANLEGPHAPVDNIEALSQELTGALRASARTIQAPGTETLAAEVAQLGEAGGYRFGPRVVVALTICALILGLALAWLTNPAVSPQEQSTVLTNQGSAPGASRSMPAQARSVPIYYVGRQDGALYRELRDLSSSGDIIRSAVEALLTVPPADPDYKSMWNAGQVLDIIADSNSITINLSAQAYEDLGDVSDAAHARDQMVYTVSDLVADPNLRVHFLSDGGTPPAAFAAQEGFSRTSLAPMPAVWITSPRNLAKLNAGATTINGLIKPGQGAPMVRVANTATGDVLLDQPAITATHPDEDGWLLWSISLNLPPGKFDVVAIPGGAPTDQVDTKTFEVT